MERALSSQQLLDAAERVRAHSNTPQASCSKAEAFQMSPSPSARPDEHLDKIMPLFTCSKPLPYVAYRTPSSCLGLFVSLYGGVGNMATAFQSEGYHGLLIDSAWNQQNNINCIGVQEEISQVLANHQLPTKFVGMDLPCESWTRARGGGGGPPRIRVESSFSDCHMCGK